MADAMPPLPAATRHAIQGSLKRCGGNIIDQASLDDWEAIARGVGISGPDDVARVVYDLVQANQAETGTTLRRPYAAADLAPFAPLARRKLDARRALHLRITQNAQKETA